MKIKLEPHLGLGIFLFLLLACPGFSFAAIIFVNSAAVGANNGTSWADAYTSLTTALTAASSGDEIWVAQGVYKPVTQVDVNGSGGADAQEVTFQIPSGIALFGGFDGTEVAREERDWETHLTILSGDIDNNDVNVDGNFIAESITDIAGNNAYHVLYTVNVSAATQLDGFIVTAGKGLIAGVITDANKDGAGWYNLLSGVIHSSSPTILNTTFQGNYATSEGGAIYNTFNLDAGQMTSLIKDCIFTNNKADVNGGAIVLGSFHVGDYHPHITGCKFIMNEAFRRGGGIYAVGDHMEIDSTVFQGNQVTAVSPDASTLPGSGGAVTIVASNATFTDCTFDGNTSTGNPTGPFEGGGGGAVNISTNGPQTAELGPAMPRFVSCGFYNNSATGNTAAWGGAVNHLNDAGILKPRYVNCVFADNSAQNDGGAVSNFTRVIGAEDGVTPALEPNFTNCTFTGNNAGQRGGGIFSDGFVFMGTEILTARIDNTILWDNTATVAGPEIYTTGIHLNSYSLLEGSGGSSAWVAAYGTDGGNNIDANPGFTDAASPKGADNIPANNDDGLHLVPASPAADHGNNAAIGLAGIAFDYTGVSRVLGSSVDIGAYERAGIVIPHIPIYWLYNWKPFLPGCLSCPWSVLLLDRVIRNYIWDGPAQLIDNEEAAVITGHIVSPDNNKIGFNVYLKLEKKQDWKAWNAQGGTYVAFTLEALRAARANHTLWTFWQLSPESFLEGTGDVSGKLLLKTIPSIVKTGFQLGEGANGWDRDFGLGGSFAYAGKLVVGGKRQSLAGVGSLNVDAVLCNQNCTPLIETSRSLTELAVVKSSDDAMSVYPIPARSQLTISTASLPSGKYTVKFYNDKGLLRKQETLDTDNGDFNLSLQDVEPGLYVLTIISPSGNVRSRKLTVE